MHPHTMSTSEMYRISTDTLQKQAPIFVHSRGPVLLHEPPDQVSHVRKQQLQYIPTRLI